MKFNNFSTTKEAFEQDFLDSNNENSKHDQMNSASGLFTPKPHHSVNMYIRSIYFHWVFNVYPLMYPLVYPLAIMFQVITVWLNVAMSVDRFIAVHFPLKSLKFCTIHNANKMITLILGLSVLYSLPRFLEYRARKHSLEFKITNHSIETMETITAEITEIGRSHLFINIVRYCFSLFLKSNNLVVSFKEKTINFESLSSDN